jgi:prepilin-type N-terminal cleavage/methylation domain-containing protein
MSGRRHAAQSGFSAVELLITLFVAAAFLATGYQLYYSAINASGESRMRAIASNIAYDKLRFYAAKVTDPCAAITASPTPTIPAGSGLGSAAISVVTACPFGSTHTSRVTVTVTYGSPQQEVSHVIYATPNL